MPDNGKIIWKTSKKKLSDLIPSNYNPRQATKKQAKDLALSLERFDVADPIIINTNNRIIGGHFRYNILKGKGIKSVDVRIPSRQLSEEEEKELNIRLNKNLGEWDFDMLANFDEEFLKMTGFSSEEMDRIFGLGKVMEDGFGGTLKKAKTKQGDIYQLGKHRLMCGDATKEEDVKKLMNGQKGQMVFTDPPYNVGYCYEEKYKFRYSEQAKGTKKDYIFTKSRYQKRREQLGSSIGAEIYNDKMSDKDFYEMLLKAFKNYYDFTSDTMAIYICHASSTEIQFRQAMQDAGFHCSQKIIWLKNKVILALGQEYHRVYEPIYFGWKKNHSRYSNHFIPTEKALWMLDRKTFEEYLDVWYIKSDKPKDYIHPTQKPIRLSERAITKNSQRNQIVLDFFGGSGSTLMACEQLERICYTAELDPIYCDAIIKRWEDYTKEKAVLTNGKTRTETRQPLQVH